jgi:hypothetical protein
MLIITIVIEGFTNNFFSVTTKLNKRILSMEYIPDGLSKEQWAKLKKAEAESLKVD